MDKRCDVLCFQTIIRCTFCEKCMCKCKVDLISSIPSHVGEGIENAYSLAKATNRFQSKQIPNTLFWFNSARTQNAIHEDQMDLIHTSSALYSINQLTPKFHAFLSSEIPVSRFHVIFFARLRFGCNRYLSSARAFYLGFNSFPLHSPLSCKTFFVCDISHLFFHYAGFPIESEWSKWPCFWCAWRHGFGACDNQQKFFLERGVRFVVQASRINYQNGDYTSYGHQLRHTETV